MILTDSWNQMLLINLQLFIFVSVKGLYKLISWWLNLLKRWLFVLASAHYRSALCWFQLTLRYTSISTNVIRWDVLKLTGSRGILWEILAKLLIVRDLVHYERALGNKYFVAFRSHVVETWSLPICSSLCYYLWEQLIFLSLDLFCKPKYSNC